MPNACGVCDFIQTYDLLFRQVYAFFLVHLALRRLVHVAATRHPTQEWTAQQLRNATMDGDLQPLCYGIATTSSVPRSTARLRASARR